MDLFTYLAVGIVAVNSYTFFLWPFVFLYAGIKLVEQLKKEEQTRELYVYFLLAGVALLFLSANPLVFSMFLEVF